MLVTLAATLLVGFQAAQSSDSVPPHDTLMVASSALGETRRINVHLPAAYSTTRRAFPTLYMPDGGIDEDFPHVVRTVDSLVAGGLIRPVIVVGIPNTQRRRDLTGPTRFAKDSAIAPKVGGSAAFRRFIRDELFPAVRARYRVTDERSLVGESLAGLFVVETLLRDPGMFRHYVALDPSLWWNGGQLVDSTAALLRPDGARATLFFASSSEPIIATEAARLETVLRTASPTRMVWTHVPRPDLTHATIFRGIEAEAFIAALR